MKQYIITKYTFEELNPEAQQSAIDKNKSINIEHWEWYHTEFEDFETDCKEIGFGLYHKKGKISPAIYFDVSYSQSSYSAFECSISNGELITILNNIHENKTPKHITVMNLPTQWTRIVKLMENGWIDFSISTECKKGYMTKHLDFDLTPDDYKPYPNIENAAKAILEYIDELLTNLNSFLFKQLRDSYEYATSNEAVKDTLIANEYEFDEKGNMYFGL